MLCHRNARASASPWVANAGGPVNFGQVEPAGAITSHPKRSLSEAGASDRKSRSERDSL